MKLLKRLRNDAILLLVIGTAGCIAYQLLLDDEAKRGISSLARTVGDSYAKLSKLADEHLGTIMDDEVVAENRRQIRDAWEAIGF